MLKMSLLLALSLGTLLGCDATPIQPATPAPAIASKAVAPKTISPNQMRRVLADGSASIWGFTYTQSYRADWGRSYSTNTYTGNVTTTNGGAFVRADYNRYIYTVPDDRVLVINYMRGGNKSPQVLRSYQGTVSINGFAHNVDGEEVYYVFGPGEMVVFTLYPTTQSETGGSGYYYNSGFPLSVSGYTASPSLFAGVGGGLGGK